MSRTALLRIHRALLLLWLTVLAGLGMLVLAAKLAPIAGGDVYVIRGASMSPAIPLGSLVFDDRPAADAIRPGDVITLQLPDGILLSHRVTRVAQLPAGLHFETKGDANATPDPVLIPASSVVGRVAIFVPLAGYLLAMLSLPTGMISAVSMLASLYLAILLVEDLESDPRLQKRAARPVEGAGAPA